MFQKLREILGVPEHSGSAKVAATVVHEKAKQKTEEVLVNTQRVNAMLDSRAKQC